MSSFSVITVCFNEADSIRDTCESVCAQTYTDFEWIVIDGGSTDGTLDVLAEYKDRISCLLSESDDGIYAAMNKGVSQAGGDYLVFMNGGDCFSDSRVLTRVSNAPPVDIICGDMTFVDGGVPVERVCAPDQLTARGLRSKMVPHQASFVRRKLVVELGGFDESYRIAAAYDLWIRLLRLEKISYCHIPEPLALFRLDGISANPEYRIVRKKENHLVRKKYFLRYRCSWKSLRQELRQLPQSMKSGRL